MKEIVNKPTLYPVEYIIKPIQVEGKQIVVIEELLKLVVSDESEIAGYEVYKDVPGFFAVKLRDVVFGYDKDSLSFFAIDMSNKQQQCIAVKNQWRLFLLLLKNRIDFRGWIDEGKAVSIV